MRARRPSCDNVCYELLDCIRQPGCPLCRLATDACERWLCTLFREQVNDGLTRERLRHGRAFCVRHAEQALRIGDPLSSSILYGDLLRRALEALPRKWDPRCVLCEYEADVVQTSCRTLLEHIEGEDMRRAYEASDGLCLPHLRLAVGGKETAASSLLMNIERRRVGTLARECEGFVAKSDYLNDEPLTPGETTAWRRAARKLSGEGGRGGHGRR